MNSEKPPSIVLGDVEITRVVERQGPFGPARHLLPQSTPEMWTDNRHWLAPDHWDPETDLAGLVFQTWVLRSGGRTVLVDTGVGNDRERPGLFFHRWRSDLPAALARVGGSRGGPLGLRGVVTLAFALTLPAAMPGRDLMLVSAFAVIFVTVLIQGTTLGLVVRLLAPREDERSQPPLDLAALSFPELTAARERLLAKVIKLSGGAPRRALDDLGLSQGLAGELARNVALRTAPAAPAGAVYTGVLYERLRLPELPAPARDRHHPRPTHCLQRLH